MIFAMKLFMQYFVCDLYANSILKDKYKQNLVSWFLGGLQIVIGGSYTLLQIHIDIHQGCNVSMALGMHESSLPLYVLGSHDRLFVIPWNVASLLCPWNSIQEYWSGL